MKLQTLKSFEVLNNETISLIAGGTARDSKKKDVTSTSHDCASGDTFN
jgi:hypothetical protein